MARRSRLKLCSHMGTMPVKRLCKQIATLFCQVQLNSHNVFQILLCMIDHSSMVKSGEADYDALTLFLSFIVKISFPYSMGSINHCIRNTHTSFFAHIHIFLQHIVTGFFLLSESTFSGFLSYCFNSSISDWFVKICFFISRMCFCSIALADSNFSIFSSYSLSYFTNSSLNSFSNYSGNFSHVSSKR